MMLDPRGPRFAAAVTSLVLVVVLLTGSGWLALAQAVVFALGAASARLAPYGAVYRVLVAPRLAPPAEREPAAPVRFAQGVGFVFAAVAAAGYLGGVPVVGAVAAAGALVAALLNAVFGLCLGCELYLLLRRAQVRRRTS
jgi:Domain of unknown function (DUF4395)